MTNLAIPPFIKTIFNTFPLYTLPPLQADLPHSLASPVLYVLENHPKSLSMRLYMEFRKLSYMSHLTSPDSHPVHPFLVVSREDILYEERLLRWIEDHGHSINEIVREVKDEIEAFTVLFENIEDAWILAHHTDQVGLNLLGARSVAVDRLLALQGSWDRVVGKAEKSFGAISDKLADNDWLCGTFGPTWVDALCFGYTHLLLRHDTQKETPRMAELQWAVKRHDNILRRHDRLLEQYPSIISHS